MTITINNQTDFKQLLKGILINDGSNTVTIDFDPTYTAPTSTDIDNYILGLDDPNMIHISLPNGMDKGTAYTVIADSCEYDSVKDKEDIVTILDGDPIPPNGTIIEVNYGTKTIPTEYVTVDGDLDYTVVDLNGVPTRINATNTLDPTLTVLDTVYHQVSVPDTNAPTEVVTDESVVVSRLVSVHTTISKIEYGKSIFVRDLGRWFANIMRRKADNVIAEQTKTLRSQIENTIITDLSSGSVN